MRKAAVSVGSGMIRKDAAERAIVHINTSLGRDLPGREIPRVQTVRMIGEAFAEQDYPVKNTMATIVRQRKKTKREEFLEAMDQIIPWQHWINLINVYYCSEKRRRPPKEIETMLRMYTIQNWFNLSDEDVEDAIYDSYAMRSFMHIDFITEQFPDPTTRRRLRHLLEEHKIGERIFANAKARLESAGLIIHGGIIVDAAIIAIPGSTKSGEGERDVEAQQTKGTNARGST